VTKVSLPVKRCAKTLDCFGQFSAGCQIIDNPDGYFRDPTWSNFWLPIRNGMKEHDLPTIPYMLVDVGDLG
jgi:hypothetical protein